MLSSELAGFTAQLSELGRPVVQWLIPGLSQSQIEEGIGVSVPDDVATWFGWCNGVRYEDGQIQDDVNVIPGYSPLSLREALQLKSSYEGDPNLAPQWLPILGGASGDIYAAVWGGGAVPKVAGVLVGEPTEIEFDSIEQMISVFRACYENRAFYLDGQGRLAMDPGAYEAIYADIVGR